MPPRHASAPWYAVRLLASADVVGGDPDTRWMTDPPEAYRAPRYDEFGRSVWFDARGEAIDYLAFYGLKRDDHELVRLSVDPAGGNHFLMEVSPWR